MSGNTQTGGAAIVASLITADADSGYRLAVALSRAAVKLIQPDATARERLRPVYEGDANTLVAASHVVAVHFQTIAAANNYWKG